MARRATFKADDSQTRPRELSAEHGADEAHPDQNRV
jgi:hypothetical protein